MESSMFTVEQSTSVDTSKIDYLREEFRKSQERVDELTATNALLQSRQRAIVMDMEHFFQSYADDYPGEDSFTIKVEDINEFLSQYGAGPILVMQQFTVVVSGTFEYEVQIEATSAEDAEEIVRDELEYTSFGMQGEFTIDPHDYETTTDN